MAIQLRADGIDIVRCQDVGLEDEGDDVHLEYAVDTYRTDKRAGIATFIIPSLACIYHRIDVLYKY